MIVACWLSGIIGFIPLFGWKPDKFLLEECDPTLIFDLEFIVFSISVELFIPTVILLIIYSLIYRKIVITVN